MMNSKTIQFFKALLLVMSVVCSHFVQSQPLALDWALSIGGSRSQEARSIISDASGNVLVTGYFQDTVDFDPGPGEFSMVDKKGSIFIAKYDATGKFVWARQVGSDTSWILAVSIGQSISLDPAGNILVSGSFTGSGDFDPGPDTFRLQYQGGQADAFVLKLDTAGHFVWAVSYGGSQLDDAKSVVADSAGNVYVTGLFVMTADLDPGPGVTTLVASRGSSEAYVLKLDRFGKFVWATNLNNQKISLGTGLALDGLGNIYASGSSTIMNYNSIPTWGWAGEGPAMFVWKLDTSGNTTWFYQPEEPSWPDNSAQSIAWDPAGFVYTTGYQTIEYGSMVDFDLGPGVSPQEPHVSDYGRGIFVLKLDTAGKYVWVQNIATTDEYAEAYNMAIDASGNLYVTGYFGGLIDFDPGPAVHNLSAPSLNLEGFAFKMKGDGSYLWAENIGAASRDWGFGIHADRHGSVYTTGFFSETVDFDPGAGTRQLTAIDGVDAFVQKLVCYDTTAAAVYDTACTRFTFNHITYKETGIYRQLLPNASGCDSIISLHLFIPQLYPLINVNGFVLGTTIPFTTYQWLLNDAAIPGATGANYTVAENGNYRVVVTNERGCSDTSAPYTVSNVAIEDHKLLTKQIQVYPNPTGDRIYIKAKDAVAVSISSLDGKLVRKYKPDFSFSLKDLADGIYLLRITDKEGALLGVEKIVKQKD